MTMKKNERDYLSANTNCGWVYDYTTLNGEALHPHHLIGTAVLIMKRAIETLVKDHLYDIALPAFLDYMRSLPQQGKAAVWDALKPLVGQ